MLIFEYWGDFQSTAELMEFYDSLPSDQAPPGLIKAKPPKLTVGLSAKAVSYAQVQILKGYMNGRGLQAASFTCAGGETVAGFVTSLNATPMEHMSPYYNVKMGVRVDGNPGVTWHFWGNLSGSKELMEFWGGKPGNNVPYSLIDSRPAKCTMGVSARGVLPVDVVAAYDAMNKPCGTASYTTPDGLAVSGIITAVSGTPIEHTGLYELRVSVRSDGTYVSGDASTIPWVWYGGASYEKSLEEFYPAPSAGAYGTPVFYDQKKPKIVGTASAKGVDAATVTALMNAINGQPPLGVYSVNTVNLGSMSGLVTSLSLESIEYTTLNNIKLSLRIQ